MLLGIPGTGKTTLIKQIIKRTKRERIIIVTADGIQWEQYKELKLQEFNKFKGVRKVFYNKSLFQYFDNQKLRDCILILDDFRGLKVRSTKEKDALETMILRRRHRMLEIIIAAHGFTQIKPRYILSYDPEFILYETSDSIKLVQDVLQKPAEIFKLQQEVNLQAKKNPNFHKRFKTN